jgi:flagellar hook assembly protein FlgD
MTQAFLVNSTIGFLATEPKRLYLPPRGRDLRIGWKQTKYARVVVTVETPAGEVIRTLAKRRYGPGLQGVTWNGLDRTRKAVKGGRYVVRVVAKNPLGSIDLARPLGVQRVVGPKP